MVVTMLSDPIIPSTGEVRAVYIRDHTRNFDSYQVGRSLTSEQEFYGAKFDRWLAAHDAAVRADMQPREVRTVEELDALPDGSIAMNHVGRVPWRARTAAATHGGYRYWTGEVNGVVEQIRSDRLRLPTLLLFTPSTPNQTGAES